MILDRQPWRPAYETEAVIGWGAAAAWVLYLTQFSSMSIGLLGMFAVLLYLAAMRGYEAWEILAAKWALLGKPITLITPQAVKRKMDKKPGHLWLGWGFEWRQEEAQLYEELSEKKQETYVPMLLRKLKRKWPKKGIGLIHGVNPNEKDIYISYESLAGHCFIPSTTGSLKTRLLALIALQAIFRKPKQTVIIIDPKGDPQMLNLVRWACKAAGRADDFCMLHPAFPRSSVRFDMMKSWTTTTEGASRIAELMGGDESSAPFKAYGWLVINNIIQAMLAVGERPQLKNVRQYLEAGADNLIYRVLVKHIRNLGLVPEEVISRYMEKAKKDRRKKEETPLETVAAIMFYKAELRHHGKSHPAIDGLLNRYEHDAAHFSKMVATLQPIMTMLTTDELGELLSPDYNNTEDKREILDNGRLLRTGRVFYLGLHSMPDQVVSSAIGSMYLADLVAVLGERNVRNESKPEVTLLLDEANEVVNPPLVSMLNKGRSAGLMVYFFTQTIQDFISKYGAEAPAMQLLGNSNNVLFGRSLEPSTLEYLQEKAGETRTEKRMEQFGITPVAGGNITDYGANYGVRKDNERTPLIRKEIMQAIPDMEYFGIFTGRRIIKGRVPVVTLEDAA